MNTNIAICQLDQPKYRLMSHVFACVANGYLVFLDLRRDRYFCLDRKETPAVCTALDIPLSADQSARRIDLNQTDCDTIIKSLCEAHAITSTSGVATTTPVQLSKPTSAVTRTGIQLKYEVTALDLLRFWSASVRASVKLRYQRLERTVEDIHVRRTRNMPKTSKRHTRRLIPLVHVFHQLRPYFPRPYLCTFDSLALLEFLAYYALYPDWVFAVRMDPFGAHCWVQNEELVLNDTLEYVSSFTPIMTA